MDRPLLLTITVSQPWGDSAGDWMQKVSMALSVNAQHLPAQLNVMGEPYMSSPINLPVGPRQAMQVVLNKQQQLLLLFSCL
jgi:hypothetical protein